MPKKNLLFDFRDRQQREKDEDKAFRKKEGDSTELHNQSDGPAAERQDGVFQDDKTFHRWYPVEKWISWQLEKKYIRIPSECQEREIDGQGNVKVNSKPVALEGFIR